MKILVADDDLMSRRILQQLLSRHGEVQTCVSGAEAVELYRLSLEDGQPFSLICLDVMMPEDSGLDALSRIRRLEGAFQAAGRAPAKILMVTGRDDSRTIMTAFRNLCDGYLCKPIEPSVLFKQIEELVAVQRA